MNCHCGCGTETKRKFAPGHDQKLRAALERRTGGLAHLERLIDASEDFARGTQSQEAFEATVREIFTQTSDSSTTSAPSPASPTQIVKGLGVE